MPAPLSPPPSTPPLCRMVCISRLPPELKRQVWAFVKAHRPDTAALLTGADPNCPFTQMAEVFGETTIWLPVADTGLTDAEIASLTVSMVSWRGAGISLPTPMRSPEADSFSGSASRARSASRTRR